MSGSIRIFRETQMRTECDACGVRFDLVKGGVCTTCRRILCAAHLHGSFFRRLLVDLGAAARCLDCRAGWIPAAPDAAATAGADPVRPDSASR